VGSFSGGVVSGSSRDGFRSLIRVGRVEGFLDTGGNIHSVLYGFSCPVLDMVSGALCHGRFCFHYIHRKLFRIISIPNAVNLVKVCDSLKLMESEKSIGFIQKTRIISKATGGGMPWIEIFIPVPLNLFRTISPSWEGLSNLR